MKIRIFDILITVESVYKKISENILIRAVG